MQEYVNIALILVWPLICCLFFTRFDTVTSVFIAIVGGMLLLPVKVEFDLPLIPPVDKNFSATIGAILGLVLVKKKPFNWFGARGGVKLLVISMVALPFVNLLFNTDSLFNGGVWKPGLSLHEAISSAIEVYLMILPLIIGINVVEKEEDLIKLLKLLVLATILYLPFILFEIRFSPQLHKWVYGFFPHDFIQQVRSGGYRAVVFLGHGLLTANFYLGGFIALLLLLKLNRIFVSTVVHYSLILIIFVSLVLLKSVSAIALALLAICFALLPIGNMRIIALKIVIIAIAVYPLISYSKVIPLDWLHSNLQGLIAIERLDSLYYRFNYEGLFLEYLGSHILIGYGGLGRSFLYGGVADGTWLIWTMRYGAIFWMLLVYLYSFAVFNISQKTKRVTAILSVLPTVILIDQIPNSSWSLAWIWVITGAVIGLSKLNDNKVKG